MQPRIPISIAASTIWKTVGIILLVLSVFVLKDVLFAVIASVVLASALEPGVLQFAKYKINRVFSAIIIYIILFVIFTSLLVFVAPPLIEQTSTALARLPKSIQLQDILGPFGQVVSLGVNNTGEVSIQEVSNAIRTTLLGDEGTPLKVAGLAFGSLVNLVLIIVLSFYLLAQKSGVADFLELITPERHETYIKDLWKRSQQKIGFWLQAQLILGIFMFIMLFLILSVLGVPEPLLLATIGAFCEIIPVFGPFIGAVPSIALAFTAGGASMAIIVAVVYLLLQAFESNLLYPAIVKKMIGLSPLVVILALVIGAKLGGFLGAILAIPISAILLEYINDREKDRYVRNQSKLETQ